MDESFDEVESMTALRGEHERRWRVERARLLLADLWGDELPGGGDPLGTYLVDAIAVDDHFGGLDEVVVQGDGLTYTALAGLLAGHPPEVRDRLLPAGLLRKLPPLPPPVPGVWEWRLDSDTFVWDEACARLLHHGERAGGSPARQLLEQCIDPGDHVVIERGLRATVETGAPYREDFRVLDAEASGAQEWLTATGRLINFPSDQPVRIIGFVERRVEVPVLVG